MNAIAALLVAIVLLMPATLGTAQDAVAQPDQAGQCRLDDNNRINNNNNNHNNNHNNRNPGQQQDYRAAMAVRADPPPICRDRLFGWVFAFRLEQAILWNGLFVISFAVLKLCDWCGWHRLQPALEAKQRVANRIRGLWRRVRDRLGL